MAKVEDLTGRRFGRLVVLNREPNNKHGKTRWKCRCDCGNEKVVGRAELVRGETRSCGCLAHDRLVQYNKENKVTHGLHGTRIYVVWKDMLYRCEKEYDAGYKHYGARGIKVCEAWHDLKVFAEWAYATGYDENAPFGECTLERIDVNGDYCPENCTWTNMFEQNCNRRIIFMVDVDGTEKPLMKASKELAINQRAVYARMYAHGDTFQEAVEHTKKHKNKRLSERWRNGELSHEKLYTLNGKQQNISAWAREYNVDRRKLSAMLAKGEPLDKALGVNNPSVGEEA